MVVIEVTSKDTGIRFPLAPYSPKGGTRTEAIYKVPTYWIEIKDKSNKFKAIRFGLINKGLTPPPKKRRCDVGLFKERTYTGRWRPGYELHSTGSAENGAIKVYKAFLIHDGPDESGDSPSVVFGTYGCIEICGKDEWTRFLNTIKSAGGADLASLSKNGKIRVHIHGVARSPDAELV